MNARTVSLIAVCAALAACNSKPAENTSKPADTATPIAQASVAAPAQPAAIAPAPEGLPSRIAREVIASSHQACAGVAKAERAQDGSITASCSSGESYRVYTDPGKGPVAIPQ